MSYVDDDILDEDPAPRRSGRGSSRRGRQSRPPRPRTAGPDGGSPLQQRNVRMLIVAGLLLVLVLVAVTSIRGCQRDKLVQSYKTFLAGANAIADESAQQGSTLRTLLDNKDFKKPAEIRQAVGELGKQADVLVARAKKLKPPDRLKASKNTLISALEYRRDGLNDLPAAIDAAVNGKDANNKSATLALPLQTLAASDVIYRRSFVGPTSEALQKDKIKDVTVKESEMFPGGTSDATSQSGAAKILASITQRRGTTNPDGTATGGGKHGLSLVNVFAVRGTDRIQLIPGSSAISLGNGSDVKFEVTVENSGDFLESNINVTLTYSTPINQKGQAQVLPIDQIDPGTDNQKVLTFNGPSPPYFAATSTVTVDVGTVDGEVVTTNNKASYPVKFDISG